MEKMKGGGVMIEWRVEISKRWYEGSGVHLGVFVAECGLQVVRPCLRWRAQAAE
jgi:hypothetical protein